MRKSELFGKRGQQIALGEVAHVDQDLAELFAAALALQFERAVEIFRGDQAALDQDLSERRRGTLVTVYCSCSSMMAASSGWLAWRPSLQQLLLFGGHEDAVRHASGIFPR